MDLQALIEKADLRRMAEDAGAHFEPHGRQLRSVCPLHTGANNPTSFVVRPAEDGKKATWRCYTQCDEGGDALTFFMRWKGFSDYEQGIQEFAKYLGVELDWKPDPQKIQEEKERRLRADVLEIARRYYQDLLWSEKGAAALAYIRGRKLTDATIRELGWGYSDSGPGLYQHLVKEKANIELAMNAGLVRRVDNDDFTANGKGKQAGPNGYIVFPHMVHQQCNYLSSRAVETAEKPLPDPKDKSRNLPGHKLAYRVEQTGKLSTTVTLVEGPFDAATVYQMGFSSWAMMGLSGLGDDELKDLKGKKAVYLSVDSDRAGQEKVTGAKTRLVSMCQALGPLTMVLPSLPDGKDFNAWLQAKKPVTAAAIEGLMGAATTWYEIRLHQAKACPPFERDERYLEIGQMIAGAPDSSKSWFAQKAHEILGMTKKEIQELSITALGRNNGHAISEIRNRQITILGKPLGNFWARITNEMSLEDGLNPATVRFTLTGGLMSGEPLPSVDIDAAEFYAMAWIARQWGARPILYVSRGQLFELARAIQEVSANLVRERVFTYTGWADVNGKWSYLSRSGRISADGFDAETRVDLGPNNLRYYALPCPPEGEEAYRAVRASLDFLKVGARTVTAMLWASMYAAPLTVIIPLYAVLWVYGTTQTGKSTITHLALTHFGKEFIDGRRYHAPIEFSMSTFAAIEGAAFVTKDAPLVIDDFAPQFASKQEAATLHRIAHAIVRAVGNRSGKGRSQANLKEQITRAPRGMVIATAENPLTGQSTVGRLIYLPVAKGDVIFEGGKINERLNEAQTQGEKGLYAQAMSVYIRWLADHWESVEENLRSQANTLAAAMRRDFPNVQNRLPDYFGLLGAAQRIALDAFEEMGYITAHEGKSEYEANLEAIRRVVVQQAEAISAESPVRKVMMALGSLIQRRRGYLAMRRSPRMGEKAEGPPPDNAELLGWYDPADRTTVWMETENILAVAKNYWRSLDENLDIFPDTLRRQIDQAGILTAKDADGKHIEVKARIQGSISRVLAVSVERVKVLYDVNLLRSEKEGDEEDEKNV